MCPVDLEGPCNMDDDTAQGGECPMDVDMEEVVETETSSTYSQTTEEENSVESHGYQPHAPSIQTQTRRGSMSEAEEKERRASIKAIMADTNLSPRARRRSIQNLMDGRRGSLSSSCSYHSSRSNTPQPSDQMDQGFPVPPQICTTINVTCQSGVSNDLTKRAELTRPRCTHYERNCTMIAPCCGAAFGCRICHDDCPVLPPLLVKRRTDRRSSLPSSFTSNVADPGPASEQDTHHTIDRFKVREIICRQCFTRQSSKTNNCVNCNIQFGEYHCSICNLWMSDDEKPYHCHDCGFCRVGGAENFRHCHDCGMCIDRSLYSNHNCKSGKYKSNCPVCQEFLFSSRSASHEMPCGHAIHWECFRQLAAHDSRCPVCKKTAETRERMMPTWNAMAAGVALQPVPPELARVVNISCNDCEQQDDARAWHFLGVQCRNCQSFNTVVDRIVMSGEEAHEFLEAMNTRNMLANIPQRNFPRISRRRSNFM